MEQNSEDEPAGELLKRIEAEKRRLVRTAKIRKEKSQQLIDNETALFCLPDSWEWTSIRQITTDRGQKVPDKIFSYIDVSAIDKEQGKIGEPQVLTPDTAPSRARKIVQKGDVIYSCVRPYLLNIAVVDDEFKPEPIVSTAFAVLNGFGLVLPRLQFIIFSTTGQTDGPARQIITTFPITAQLHPNNNEHGNILNIYLQLKIKEL